MRLTLLGSHILELLNQLQVLVKVLGAEARKNASEVGGFKVVDGPNLARQKATAKRRVGKHGDAELAAGGEQIRACLVLDVELPWVVLDLNGINRRDLVRSPDRVG